jgi:predicted PhzF superfamily epimerase YddE/YHI9
MTDVHVIRVFTGSNSKFGDLATVVIDEGRKISDADRQALARQLNTGETAFVNDMASANISIMHPQGEIDFAGVAALGTAWLLSKLSREPIDGMKGRGGNIIVSQDGGLTWVRASLATMPPWHHKQLENSEAVEHIALEETKAWEHTMVWTWIDETKGLIRARTFAADWDIPEAQGNGSGSMMLAAMLSRTIEIRHGEGCVVLAKPAPDNCADIGGRVIEEPNIIITL